MPGQERRLREQTLHGEERKNRKMRSTYCRGRTVSRSTGKKGITGRRGNAGRKEIM
jgi:hypothetical protein